MKLIKTSDPDSKERKIRAELLMNKLINFMDSDDMWFFKSRIFELSYFHI